MRRQAIGLASAVVLLATAGASATVPDNVREASGGGTDNSVATIAMRDTDGDRVGTVWARQLGPWVLVTARVHSLTPGFHGFHVHQTAKCEPNAAGGPFTTAGGHHTGGHASHGDHAGDLPSLLVAENGRAHLSFLTDRFTIAELRDADGSAVMVHEGRDNFANIPERYTAGGTPGPDAATLATGDAGARAACGVIDDRPTYGTVSVPVRNVAGGRIGTVWLRQAGASVEVSARLHSLTPGFHGFHVHQTGLCEADAAGGPFTTAGGHYTGGQTTHGHHAGDMPSLRASDNGKAHLTFVTDAFTIAELRDADGSAVMVHEGRDNFANIPERYTSGGTPGPDAATLATGDAGSRAACGAIAGTSSS